MEEKEFRYKQNGESSGKTDAIATRAALGNQPPGLR